MRLFPGGVLDTHTHTHTHTYSPLHGQKGLTTLSLEGRAAIPPFRRPGGTLSQEPEKKNNQTT